MEIEAEPESGWNSLRTSSRSYRNSALIYFGEESFANNVYSGSKSTKRKDLLTRTLPDSGKPFYMRKALYGSIASTVEDPAIASWMG